MPLNKETRNHMFMIVYKLFVSKLVAWSNSFLQMIIINYLRPYKYLKKMTLANPNKVWHAVKPINQTKEKKELLLYMRNI